MTRQLKNISKNRKKSGAYKANHGIIGHNKQKGYTMTHLIEKLSPEFAKRLIDEAKPVTHLVAGVGKGKTYQFSHTSKETKVLFVTTNNTIKAQTNMEHGFHYSTNSLIDAFKACDDIRGVVSAEALLGAYKAVALTHSNMKSFNYYLSLHIDAVVLDEFHLYITEAGYRPQLGELYELLKAIRLPIITLTATPVYLADGDTYLVKKTKSTISKVVVVELSKDAGKVEKEKIMTAKAYAKDGREDGILQEDGKYLVTDVKNIKKGKGFAKAQKLNALGMIAEKYLDDSQRTGLIIYSEESKAVSRGMVDELNSKYTDLNMVMMDRDLFDKAQSKLIQIRTDKKLGELDEEEAEEEIQAVYTKYPFMSLYESDQLLNRPLMVTSFGKQGLNILDDVDAAHVVMMAGSVNRNISNESKEQVIGRFRKSSNNIIYDLVPESSEIPQAKRSTATMISTLGSKAVSKGSPFKEAVNVVFEANTSMDFKNRCYNYMDSLTQLTVGSMTENWEKLCDDVSVVRLLPTQDEFVTVSGETVKEVLKVKKGTPTYERLNEIYEEVVETAVELEKVIDVEVQMEAKAKIIENHFPLLSETQAEEVFDGLSGAWGEQIAHVKRTSELLSPIATFAAIRQYRVRKAYPEFNDAEKFNEVVAQMTPMNISKMPKRKLKIIASVLPTEYANIITGTAKFTEKREIINIWFDGMFDLEKKDKHYLITDFIPSEALDGMVFKKVDYINAPSGLELHTAPTNKSVNQNNELKEKLADIKVGASKEVVFSAKDILGL